MVQDPAPSKVTFMNIQPKPGPYDLGLFEPIHSQTSQRDRLSLLAVQSSVRAHVGEYVYLEVGSHLGGSLQPHLRDPECQQIWSIDKRPTEQPDDRGKPCLYPDNSTDRMLSLLRPLAPEQISKITCFDTDCSDLDPAKINPRPHLCFIDGEHTFAAARSDFEFCLSVARNDAIILFHDTRVIVGALRAIKRDLRSRSIPFKAAPLIGSVYAIALGDTPLLDVPELARRTRNEPFLFFKYAINRRYRKWVRTPLKERRRRPLAK